MRLGRASRAEERLDFVGGARRGEEIALEHAATSLREEVALRVVLDALGNDVEAQAPRKRNERARKAGAFVVLRDAGDELAVDAHRTDAKALEHGERGVAGAEVIDAKARAARGDLPERGLERFGNLANECLRDLDQQRFGRKLRRIERR